MDGQAGDLEIDVEDTVEMILQLEIRGRGERPP